MTTKPRRRRVSGEKLDGICPITGKKHTVWIGLTGDMLPFFCADGCRQ